MKILEYFGRLSIRIWPYRWSLGLVSAAIVGIMVWLSSSLIEYDRQALLLFFTAMFLVVWCWGGMCIAIWFHPQHGTMRDGSPWLFLFPTDVHRHVRAFGAILIAFILGVSTTVFVFGVVAAMA